MNLKSIQTQLLMCFIEGNYLLIQSTGNNDPFFAVSSLPALTLPALLLFCDDQQLSWRGCDGRRRLWHTALLRVRGGPFKHMDDVTGGQ